MAVEQHLHLVGELAGHPIGVADAKDGKSTGPFRAEAMAIAHPDPCGDFPDQADPGQYAHGALKGGDPLEMGCRAMAVEGQAYPNHVVVQLGAA